MNTQEMQSVSEYVSKITGKPTTEIASLLFTIKEDDKENGEVKADGFNELLKYDATRVQGFKDETTAAHDKGYNKAKAEIIGKFESDLKEKFALTSDKKGVELIEYLVGEKIKGQGVELDDEKIKRSQPYLDMVNQMKKEMTEAVKIETEKHTTLESSIQREKVQGSVSSVTRKLFDDLNLILPEGKDESTGKSKADLHYERFMRELSSEYDFEVKGDQILLIKDGKALVDAHNHMIDYKKFVEQRATSIYDVKSGEARKSSGNTHDNLNGGQGKKTSYAGPKIENENQYMEAIRSADNDDLKMEITAHWNETKAR